MLDWLSDLDKFQMAILMVTIAIIGGVLTTIIGTIATYWTRARRDQFQARRIALEASLKQDMLDRGMSADEIERVMKASLSSAPVDQPAKCTVLKETADYKA